MPQFLYRIKPVRLEMLTEGPTPHEAAVLAKHFEYLSSLTAKGVVFMAGRTLNNDEKTFGIVVFAAAAEEEAALLMQNDPAVKLGIMKAELFSFRAALWSSIAPTDKKEI